MPERLLDMQVTAQQSAAAAKSRLDRKMPSNPKSPRSIIRLIRKEMEKPGSIQDRMKGLVSQIKSGLSYDTCSIYILNDEETADLFATVGQKQGSVHAELSKDEKVFANQVIRTGQRSLTGSSKQGNSEFRESFNKNGTVYENCGLPLNRAGTVIGALIVRRKESIDDSEEILELLQTSAMLASEMLYTILEERQEVAAIGTSKASDEDPDYGVSEKKLSNLAKSKKSLLNLRDEIDALVARDESVKDDLGNKQRVDLSENELSSLKSIVNAGIAVHSTKVYTESHISILEKVQSHLKQFEKTLEATSKAVDSGNKLARKTIVLGTTISASIATVATVYSKLQPFLSDSFDKIGILIDEIKSFIHI